MADCHRQTVSGVGEAQATRVARWELPQGSLCCPMHRAPPNSMSKYRSPRPGSVGQRRGQPPNTVIAFLFQEKKDVWLLRRWTSFMQNKGQTSAPRPMLKSQFSNKRPRICCAEFPCRCLVPEQRRGLGGACWTLPEGERVRAWRSDTYKAPGMSDAAGKQSKCTHRAPRAGLQPPPSTSFHLRESIGAPLA